MKLEQAYAIDVVTKKARELPRVEGSHRDYGLVNPTEFFGTADFIGTLADGVPVIGDYKTGRNLGEPKVKMQLRFFALALHLITGAPIVEARYVYINEDSSFENVACRFYTVNDELKNDFEEIFSQLERIYKGIARAQAELAAGLQPRVTTGDHCQYCPAFSACPSKTALVRRMLPDLETIDSQFALMTPEQLGTAWIKYREIESIMKKVGDVLKEHANNQELPLPNGKVLRPTTQSRTSQDSGKLVQLARSKGATQGEIAACSRVNTFQVIRECVVKK